jgi:citrate synthase
MQYRNDNISHSDNSKDINGLLDKFIGEARIAYSIPEEAFNSYRVKRGLREADGTGITAGVTKIGNAHGYIIYEGERVPTEGVLEYRGYDVSQLVENYAAEGRYGFEECTYLLFFGELPTRSQLCDFCALLDAYRRLPPRFTEDILMKAPCRSLMNKIATGVLALYAYDENPDDTSLGNMLRQSIEITARMPVVAAHSYAIYKNYFFDRSLHLHYPRPELSTAQNFLRILRSNKSFTEQEAHLLDLCLVLHAEHGGGNNSSFACRVLSSSGTDTYSAISAAVGSLKGPRHGGANIKVEEMFENIKASVKNPKDDGELSDYLLKILKGEANDGSGLIYGMGHAIYTRSDPRAVMLKRYAKSLAEAKGYLDDFELLERIERLTPLVFNEYKKTDRVICANVDLYSGLVYRMLDIPVELYTPLFAVARVAGWCAHRMEEYATARRIIRPGYKCIERARQYKPLDER